MRELERDIPDVAAQDVALEAMPRLAIIGPGRAGRSIARAAKLAGLSPGLAGRDRALEVCRGAEVALLCVPDAAIRDACASVAAAVPPLRFVGHVSGATALTALAPAAERGAELFSLHPLQTIPDGDAELAGSACAVSGSSADAVGIAEELAMRLGMRPFALREEARTTYHAAASIASNLLVALEESAAGLLRKAGVEGGRELLAPLVLRTAANWAERGADALTGPIARGDAGTVERPLEALRATAPELLPVYDALAERARALASQGGEAVA